MAKIYKDLTKENSIFNAWMNGAINIGKSFGHISRVWGVDSVLPVNEASNIKITISGAESDLRSSVFKPESVAR